MTACPTCDGVRTPTDRDANSVTWHCSWCRTDSAEVFDLVRDGLMREWER